MNRRILIAGTVALAGGSVTAAALGLGGRDPKSTSQAETAPSTAPVTRGDLSRTQTVAGVLGYGTPVAVNAAGHGRITWLAALGSTVKRGQALYKVDNQPVTLFYGTLPLYRSVSKGMTGEDVREVDANLAALGYAGLAIRKWQKDLGVPQTGVVDPDAVIIAPGELRISTHLAKPGDPAGAPVLAFAGTTRVVTVALDVALQELAKAGLPAQVTLPNAKTVEGRIATVGTVATPGQNEHSPATIEVTVTIADQSALGILDQAPVTVKLTSSTVHNILSVPVTALVALAEGGYGVQLADGRYVAVRPGTFANGRVEVNGEGIAEGTLVVIPR